MPSSPSLSKEDLVTEVSQKQPESCNKWKLMNRGLMCFWPRFLNNGPRLYAENKDLLLDPGFCIRSQCKWKSTRWGEFSGLSLGKKDRREDEEEGISILPLCHSSCSLSAPAPAVKEVGSAFWTQISQNMGNSRCVCGGRVHFKGKTIPSMPQKTPNAQRIVSAQ